MAYHILIVDDDAFQRRTMQLAIEKMLRYKVSVAEGGQQAVEVLTSDKGAEIDMVILDLSMPDCDGMEVLDKIKPHRPDLPIIINTAYGDVKKAVEAIRMGATDFLEKKDGTERLKVSIENVRMLSNLNQEVNKLHRFTNQQYLFEDIIGRSKALKKSILLAKKASDSNISVLITGESGCGKELFARAIHSSSTRAEKPFIAVNCAAIPENLVESVLFGHEKGAFTGAINSSLGKFREADGGTIFLDEIGELNLDVQSKLLRVLQNFEIEPVGSGKTHDINVRIISATNKNLEKSVRDTSFREDLFYRVNVFNVNVPSLRERKEDIPLLVEHFLAKLCAREGRKIVDIDNKMIALLQEYWWPGNVRQLENTLYRAIVLCTGNYLSSEHFDGVITSLKGSSPIDSDENENSKISYFDNKKMNFKSLSKFEKDIIEEALRFYNWNISKVSKILDIGRSTLYRKMKEYDIEEKPSIEEIEEFRKDKRKN